MLKRGPAAIAMMIASEFWRANEGAEFRDHVVQCFWRARELMGVLEVVNLPEAVCGELVPYYEECRLEKMFSEERLSLTVVQTFSRRLAQGFENAAEKLAHA